MFKDWEITFGIGCNVCECQLPQEFKNIPEPGHSMTPFIIDER